MGLYFEYYISNEPILSEEQFTILSEDKGAIIFDNATYDTHNKQFTISVEQIKSLTDVDIHVGSYIICSEWCTHTNHTIDNPLCNWVLVIGTQN